MNLNQRLLFPMVVTKAEVTSKKKKITLTFQLLFMDRFLISFHKIYVEVSCDMHLDIHTYICLSV